MTGRASGFALLAVLLALLVLTGLLHGSLAVGRYHALAARAESRASQARIASESGVRLVGSQIPAAPGPSVAGARVTRRAVALGPDVAVEVSVARIGAEWLWIEGEARVGYGMGEGFSRTGAAYWTLNPQVRATALAATVEVGGGTSLASPTSIGSLGAGLDDPGYDAGTCEGSRWADPFLGIPLAPSQSRLDPDDQVVPGAVPPLGLLKSDVLAIRASDPASGTGGAVLRVADGSFTVPESGLFGVLVVAGDLEIPAGRELQGLALVGGSVTIGDGGRLVGALRVRGSLTVLGTGLILGSRCTIARTLRSLPDLSRPLPAPDGTWVRIP